MLDPLTEDDRTSPTVSTPRFVGRDRELAALRGALARPPAIVLVEGEAGIGKSRLLREWSAAPDQRTALVSVCPPLRESLTLGPIVDAFRGIDRSVSRLRLTELAGALRPLFPEWSADLPPALPPLANPHLPVHLMERILDDAVALADEQTEGTPAVYLGNWKPEGVAVIHQQPSESSRPDAQSAG